ncbi:MAG: hypothetical protein WAM94_12565, partial [Chromatiaceae bacterium]
IGPTSTAHRPGSYRTSTRIRRPARGGPVEAPVLAPKPACYTNELAEQRGPFVEHSAGWADKLGAQACTTCFPEGD